MPDGSIEIEVELNSEKAEKELKQFSKTLGTETKKAAKSAEAAAKQAVKSAETTIKQAAKAAEAATKQASKTTEQAAKKAGKTAETAAKQAGEKASQSTKKSGEEQKRSYKQTEQQAKRSAENAGKYWSGAASKIKSAVSTGIKATGAAMIAGGSAAIKVGSDFEAGMSEVQAISGASGKELESLRDKAKEMGATTKFSATQSAEALKYMAMAGWKADQMVSGLPGIMNLAAASGEDLGTVSDIVTDALTAFGLQAKDSAHFADVLAKASSSSNTNVGMMGETFKYVAPIAGSMKYSVEDTATAIGLMANAGIKGGEAGTSLRAILTRLVKPPKDAAQALDALGVSAKNSDGTMKPLREVIGDLREKFSGLDDSQKAQYAASIAGQEAMSGLLAIVNASPSDFDKLTKSIDKSNGAAKKQAKTMNNNLKGALYELGSAAEAVGIEIYDDIKGPLTNAVKAGTKQISSLSKAISKGGIKSVVPEQTITTIKNLGSAAKTVAGGGLKVLGSAAKFLGTNISAALPATISFLATLKGYTAIRAVASTVDTAKDAFKGIGTAAEVSSAILNTKKKNVTAFSTVVAGMTGSLTKGTAATGLLKAGVTALGGPIGVATLAIGALTAGAIAYKMTLPKVTTESERFAESCEKLHDEQEKFTKSVKDQNTTNEKNIDTTKAQGVQADSYFKKLKSLVGVEKKSAGQKKQISAIVAKLNELLPGLNAQYDEEKDKLNKSTAAIKKNIKAQKALVMAKAYQKGMEANAEKLADAEIKYEEAIKKRDKADRDGAAAKKKHQEMYEKYMEDGTISSDEDKALDKLQKKANDNATAYHEADEAAKGYKETIDDITGKMSAYEGKMDALNDYSDYLSNIGKLAKEAGLKAKDIPKTIGDGIKEGIYEAPQTGDELKKLISIDPMIQELKKKGQEIPISLSQGIISGKYAIPGSVSQMESLIKFDGLSQKSLSGGLKIPESLAKGIASGKIKPSEAVKQMQSLIDFSDAVKGSKKAGDDAVKALVQSVNAGKISPKKAMEELAKLMGDAGEKEAGKAGNKTGKKIDNSTAAGVDKNKGKIKTATQGAVNHAKTVDTSGFNSLGSSIASGIAAGIGGNAGVVAAAAVDVVNQALAAAKSKKGADVNSPSKKFRDKLGTAIPEGLAKGIYKGSGAVTKASVAMTQATLNAARKDLGIHSPSTVFKNMIGKNIPKGIAKGVREGKNELVEEMKSVISAALSAAKKATFKGNYSEIGSDLLSGLNDSLSIAKQRSSETVQEIIDQSYNKQVKASEKAEAKLQKKIDKLGSKKKNKKKKAKLKEELKDLKAANDKKEKKLKLAGEKAANAYNTAFEKEADRLTKIAEEKIQALSEKYQEQYDEIKNLRDNLTNKQQSYGSLYDLDQNLYDIEDYQKRLKALENKIPNSMMQRILGMDVEEGRQYMAWFQSLTAAEQKAYTDKWNKQQSMAKNFSESFFKDDFERINREYQAEIKKATDNLNAEMKKAGANVAKGLAAGITGETRNLSKAMKKLCKDIVKAAKKELKIKSPSRVFAQIGKFTIQGAEKGQEKEAPKLYRQVETVADTMAARFAKAKLNIPELQSRMQTAVSRQMGKITASVQPQVVYAGDDGTTTIEKTVYTGPEKIEVVTNIEGREAARTLAPFMDSRLNSMADRKARGGV